MHANTVKLSHPIVSLSFTEPPRDSSVAYEAVLVTKALFSEVLHADYLAMRSGSSDYEQYVELRRQISRRSLEPKAGSQVQGTKDSARADLERLAKRMQEMERAMKQAPGGSSPRERIVSTSVTSVMAKLRPGDRLLEYVLYRPTDFQSGKTAEEHYGVFVLNGTTKRVTATDLGDAATIDREITKYRALQQSQANPANPRFDEIELARYGGVLRHLLLDLALGDGQESWRVYIAPDGLIGLIPFEALPQRHESDRPRYLVEDFEVVYLITGRDLLRTSATSTNPNSEFWLFGDPAFGATVKERLSELTNPTKSAIHHARGPRSNQPRRQLALVGGRLRTMGSDEATPPLDWDHLGSTRVLLQRIAKLAHKAGLNPRVHLDVAASEERVASMRSPQIAMFATHGYFMSSQPTSFIRIDSEGINSDFFETMDPTHR